MKKVKAVHKSRTIYGTEIMHGRVFSVISEDETTATLQDRHGETVYVSMDEINECFVDIR